MMKNHAQRPGGLASNYMYLQYLLVHISYFYVVHESTPIMMQVP